MTEATEQQAKAINAAVVKYRDELDEREARLGKEVRAFAASEKAFKTREASLAKTEAAVVALKVEYEQKLAQMRALVAT